MAMRCVPILLLLAPLLPAQDDWVSLFDGKTLAGWVTKGGRYDGDARWTVEDGVLTGRQRETGDGGLIYTARQYRNFEFECEAKVDHPFDSGIFVRMSKHGKGAQVTIDYRPGGEVGAIYSDGFLAHNPAGFAKFKPDAFNHFRVRCTGEDLRLEVWMNGEALTTYRLPQKSLEYAPTGLIGLQVHGGRDDAGGKKAQFRNIRIRELPEPDAELFSSDPQGNLELTAKARAEGWEPLFDGKSLAGWKLHGGDSGARVEQGQIVFPLQGTAHELRTERSDFRDFVLRLDFKLARLANSGVFLRARPDGSNPAYSGCEVQILDDFNWEADTKSKLQAWQFSGSLYGSVAPQVQHALRPLGEWNTYEILYQGSRLRTLLNGQLLYDVDTLEVAGKPPFAERAKEGFIGLQRHAAAEAKAADYAWFRNLFVKRT